MFIIDLIFDNFWIFLIVATIINAFLLRTRSKRIIARQPELQEGYDQLFRAYLVYLNIPWVVMGVGRIFGGVSSFFSFFRPQDGNPFVLAFYITLSILWLLCAWWLYFKRGAEFLAKHPGMLGPVIRSPILIKVLMGFMLVSVPLIAILVWNW